MSDPKSLKPQIRGAFADVQYPGDNLCLLASAETTMIDTRAASVAGTPVTLLRSLN